MTAKKFRCLAGDFDSAAAAADFAAADRFDNIWIGRLGVYYKSGFKTVFAPYSAVERAFLRIQEVNGKLCCGNTTFAYYHLIFIVNGKECGDILSESEKTMKDALAAIAEAAPELAIGVA